ncbi:MAG: hypothetical protein ABIG30_03640, partial [Candidatus Aenigmatarchaeota archaeon]
MSSGVYHYHSCSVPDNYIPPIPGNTLCKGNTACTSEACCGYLPLKTGYQIPGYCIPADRPNDPKFCQLDVADPQSPSILGCDRFNTQYNDDHYNRCDVNHPTVEVGNVLQDVWGCSEYACLCEYRRTITVDSYYYDCAQSNAADSDGGNDTINGGKCQDTATCAVNSGIANCVFSGVHTDTCITVNGKSGIREYFPSTTSPTACTYSEIDCDAAIVAEAA